MRISKLTKSILNEYGTASKTRLKDSQTKIQEDEKALLSYIDIMDEASNTKNCLRKAQKGTLKKKKTFPTPKM